MSDGPYGNHVIVLSPKEYDKLRKQLDREPTEAEVRKLRKFLGIPEPVVDARAAGTRTHPL